MLRIDISQSVSKLFIPSHYQDLMQMMMFYCAIVCEKTSERMIFVLSLKTEKLSKKLIINKKITQRILLIIGKKKTKCQYFVIYNM